MEISRSCTVHYRYNWYLYVRHFKYRNLKFRNFVRKMLPDQNLNQQLPPLELSLSIGLFWQGKCGNPISEHFWCYSSQKIHFLKKFPLWYLITVGITITIDNDDFNENIENAVSRCSGGVVRPTAVEIHQKTVFQAH